MDKLFDYNNIPEGTPEAVIVVAQWGGGNYYIDDCQRGKSIRITPDTFWKIVEQAHHLINDVELNMEVQ